MTEQEGKDVPVTREDSGGRFFEQPWEPVARLRDEMDRLFDEFTSGWPWGGHRRRRRAMVEPFRGMMTEPVTAPLRWGALSPAVDVIDKEKDVEVRAELPGLSADDIDVRLNDGVLTMTGEKKEEKEEGKEGENYFVSERRYGAFQRAFRLPPGIDPEKVEATFRNGVLTITLPKTPEAQERVKKIQVKSAA